MTRGKQHRFAKKSLGQNFLTDRNYVRKILAAVDPQPTDTIIEIGPGRGAITDTLVDSHAKVLAIELDSSLAPELAQRFAENPGFRVIEADATQVNFSELLDGKKAKVVANLPYYISTAILQHLAAHREQFTSLVLMFQKEVVERITAPPGSSERGYLTVLAEAAFQVEHLFDVPPTAFRPVPKVVSSVVRLIPRHSPVYDNPEFRNLLSLAFAQKRKTLLNNLKGRYTHIANILERSGIDPRRRAESLSLVEWTALSKTILAVG